MSDLVVFTAILGGKDRLQMMPKEEGVRYICFSDTPFDHPLWEYRHIDPLGQTDMRRVCRRVKWLSHIYFPGETTLWLDGRMSLKIPIADLLSKYGGALCARPHPSRTCIYDEAAVIKTQNYDDHALVDAQMKVIKNEGYPMQHGLNETGALLRRPTAAAKHFNCTMWSIISTGSKRDQLAFNYVGWLVNQNITEMDRADFRITNHRIKTDKNR